MSDPLSAIGSIVGILGFGLQLAQILQKEIDDITTATDRVQQIVIEVRATCTGLTNLKELLLQDAKDTNNNIFNDEGRFEVSQVVRHCNTVFRNITVLVAKAGSGVLSQVDLYQRKVEEQHNGWKPKNEDDIKLEIELSNLEHLMWPWRLPTIQQYLADMDRLKLSLVLIVSVANLAQTRQRKAIKEDASDAGAESWDESDAETLVQDEIFYQDQALREAEKRLQTLTLSPSTPEVSSRPKQSAAQLVLQSWPNSPSGRGLCSIAELHDAGIVLNAYAFGLGDHEYTRIEIPLNLHSMQQHALQSRHWAKKNLPNVWDLFDQLPTRLQASVLEFMTEKKKLMYGRETSQSSAYSQLVLLSLRLEKHRRRRLLDVIKRVLIFDTSGASTRPALLIITARVSYTSDQMGRAEISNYPPSYSGSSDHELSHDSDYTSDSYASSSRERSRYNRRRSYSRHRSRSRSRKLSVLKALIRTLRFRSRRAQERRPLRSRARTTSWRSPYDYDGYASDNDTQRVDADDRMFDREPNGLYFPAPPRGADSTYVPPPPRRSEPTKLIRRCEDVTQARRVETLHEQDKSNVESALQMPSGKNREGIINKDEPVVEIPPPKRRTTTFYMDARGKPEPPTATEGYIPAAGIRNLTGTYSEIRNPQPSRRDTTAKTSRRWHLPSSRRRGSSSRSNSIEGPRSRHGERVSRRRALEGERYYDGYYDRPFPTTIQRSHRGRQSRRERSNAMGLITSSPSRLIIRTFEDDGVPPTQRDKAAVADYYLKKWTTAYDYARSRSMGTRSKPLERSRSRDRDHPRRRESRKRVVRGGTPVYGAVDAAAGARDAYYPHGNFFPPPPGQEQAGGDARSYRRGRPWNNDPQPSRELVSIRTEEPRERWTRAASNRYSAPDIFGRSSGSTIEIPRRSPDTLDIAEKGLGNMFYDPDPRIFIGSSAQNEPKAEASVRDQEANTENPKNQPKEEVEQYRTEEYTGGPSHAVRAKNDAGEETERRDTLDIPGSTRQAYAESVSDVNNGGEGGSERKDKGEVDNNSLTES